MCLVGIRKITVKLGREMYVTALFKTSPSPAEVRSVTTSIKLAEQYTAICTSDLVLSTRFNTYLIFEHRIFFTKKIGTFVYNLILMIKYRMRLTGHVACMRERSIHGFGRKTCTNEKT
jgi:hypothetical protein